MYRILCYVFMLGISCTAKKNVEDVEWRLYGNEGNNRYSPLAQIDSTNVLKLQPAWEFSTGDIDPRNNLQLQCHPIMVNGKLYVTSGRGKVYAMNAATGEQVWSFDALKDSM
ncbi:MAG TPA: PQQ-binding-like beta-propeller repeat protein, partial [Chitinophagaceae bacterium]|nr:PQQ-binding-like beta-propeller repeat protein [Chitinophagaceae bacterium]